MKARFLMLMSYLLSAGLLVSFSSGASATELNQEDGILPNHSADYVRTLNRFASTDADAAFYNPAGLAFMERKGLHIDFSSQTMYIKRSHKMKYWAFSNDGTPVGLPVVSPRITATIAKTFQGIPDEYEASVVAPVLPGLDVVWKGDKYAVYFDVHVMQAAPHMTFDQGLAALDWAQLATAEVFGGSFGITPLAYIRDVEAIRTEYYVGATIGAAYAILDWMSAAVGVRYIYAQGNQIIRKKSFGIFTDGATVTESPWLIDTDIHGHGAGLIIGLDFNPLDKLNIGVKYEYYFPMVLKKTTNNFQGFVTAVESGRLNILLDSWKKLPFWESGLTGPLGVDRMDFESYKNVGDKLKVTYPQTISIGVSIDIIKNLRTELSGEIVLRPFVDLDGREKMWNLGYKVGDCVEWQFHSIAAWSVGYLYNNFGIKPIGKYEINPENKRNEIDPLLSSHTLSTGFKIKVADWLDLTVGAFYSIFVREETQAIEYIRVSGNGFHVVDKEFDENRISVAVGLTAHFFGKTE